MTYEDNLRALTEVELREALRPVPELHYPTPWRIAEFDGQGRPVVVCDDGHYVCNAASQVTAQIIVAAVNAWAES